MALAGGRASWALDPALEDLRTELRQLFPSPSPALQASPPVAAPFSIVRREYLYTRPMDSTVAAGLTSLRRIREYPAPLRQAHAACVKVLTPGWHGSGVLVSSSGDVLTSYHLVAGALAASVQTLDGRIHPIDAVKAYSVADDLALIRIDGGSYPVLNLRTNPPPEAGIPLFAVGHPGERSWALTPGRVIRHFAEAGTQLLHFESELGRGNSGGPIVDAEGRLCAITACAAELANGSKVKVGIDGPAIRAFLARPAGEPVSLTELATRERNRQMAEFLGLVYGLTEELIVDWQAAVAEIDVEARTADSPEPEQAITRPERTPSATREAAFTRTNRSSDMAARLLILQALLVRCSNADGLSPELLRSMRHYVAVLDRLLDASELFSRRTAAIGDMRQKLKQAAAYQREAEERFGVAVTVLQAAGQTYGLTPGSSRPYAEMERVRQKYAPAGCHVTLGASGG